MFIRLISTTLCLFVGCINFCQALEIQWTENTTPINPFPAADLLNTGPFTAGNEFRMIINGTASGGGEKSVVDGTATTPLTWVFDDVTGELITVNGSDTLPAATDAQPSNPGIGTSGAGLFLNAPFLIPSPIGDFGFLAPFAGSDAGNFHGVATISRTDLATNGTFAIHVPVMELHWANLLATPGSAGGGVNFDCQVTNGSVSCTADYQIRAAEDAIGFAGQWLQFDLKGITQGAQGPFVLANLNVIGGTMRECTIQSGDQVEVEANIVLGGGAVLGSVEWFIDGAPAAMGETATLFIPFGGTHTVDMTVTTTTGETASDSTSIEVKDTQTPTLEVAFLDARTDSEINAVSAGHVKKVKISVIATDACDPNPQTNVDITPIYKAEDGEIIKIRPSKASPVIETDALKLDGVAEDASGRKAHDSATLEIIR